MNKRNFCAKSDDFIIVLLCLKIFFIKYIYFFIQDFIFLFLNLVWIYGISLII